MYCPRSELGGSGILQMVNRQVRGLSVDWPRCPKEPYIHMGSITSQHWSGIGGEELWAW